MLAIGNNVALADRLTIPPSAQAGGGSRPPRNASGRTDAVAMEEHEADIDIDVPIWTCGSREVVTVRAGRDSTIRHVQRDLAARFMVDEDQQDLVFCGKVLDLGTAVADLMTALQQGEKVWIVIRNVWRASAIESAHRMVMHSVFAFSGPAGAADPGQCCKTFEDFCQSHGIMGQRKVNPGEESRYSAPELTWRPDAADQKRLAASVHALKNTFDADCTNFPQVRWFPDYGCALLASNIDVTHLSLQVHFQSHALPLLPLLNATSADCTARHPSCADCWTRRMGFHASPRRTSAHVQFDTAIISKQNNTCWQCRPTFVQHICPTTCFLSFASAGKER